MTIYHCSSCDVFSSTAPLCMGGDAYVITDDGMTAVDRCTCVCHNGSAHAHIGDGPDGRGPGAEHDIDAEYEDLCVHEDLVAA